MAIFALACLRAPLALGAETPAADAAFLAPVEGKLPNGLRYLVLPHTPTKRDLSLRLLVRVGSLDERDDERGFAHFVEHMAFNGTRNHPPGSVRNFFQRLGLTFGADLNANTSYTHTAYLLDLPDGRADHLDEALGMLRDYADGLLFPPEEVARESGVVISELNARDSAGRRLATQLVKELYSGTPLPDRDVGGLQDQLAKATPEQLRAFYQRNYSPDRMTVVIVGAIEPAATVEKITAVFGPIAPKVKPAPATPAVVLTAFEDIKPHVIVVPTIKGSNLEIVHVGQRPADTPEGRREEFAQRIAISLLGRRVEVTRERGDVSRFSPPTASFNGGPVDPFVHHTIAIGATATDWAPALQLLESELRRARTTGFTLAEVNEAVAGDLVSLRNRIPTAQGQASAQIANEITNLLRTDRTWRSPARVLAESTPMLQALTAEEVTKALQTVLPEDGCHIVLRVPPTDVTTPDRVLAVYTKSTGRALRNVTQTSAELAFRYEDFGPAGEIAKRDRVEDLDLTLVTFANGVRLNVRPSQFESEHFRLRIVFPQNASFVSSDQGGIGELAGQILLHSNLGKHKESELSRLIKLHGISPQFSMSNGTPVFGISGPVAELPFALRFLTALMSDLEVDVDHYKIALSYYNSLQRALITNSRPFALAEAVYFYTGKDDRVIMKPAQVLARLDPSEAETWLRSHLLQGPLEIGIVGDLSADQAVSLAASTVGTLKKRRPTPKPGAPLRTPTKSSRVESTADVPASTSMSCALWPVSTPDDPRHNAALALAADVLRDRLLLVLREALGATYSPDVRIHRDAVQRDFAYAAVVNTFEPGNAIRLTEGTVRLAARTAEKGVSTDEFTRLIEPLRTRYSADLRNNGWWLNSVVSTAQSLPNGLDEARAHGKVCDELTLEDVNAAAQVFKPDAVTVVILRPASAPKAAPGAPAAPKK
jgi:zinc protease